MIWKGLTQYHPQWHVCQVKFKPECRNLTCCLSHRVKNLSQDTCVRSKSPAWLGLENDYRNTAIFAGYVANLTSHPVTYPILKSCIFDLPSQVYVSAERKTFHLEFYQPKIFQSNGLAKRPRTLLIDSWKGFWTAPQVYAFAKAL